MKYSDVNKNDSGVPSLFASSGMSTRNKNISSNPSRSYSVGSATHSPSYLKKRRAKVDILAMVDGAIEDGATDQAKQKASAERAASEAPVPDIRTTLSTKKSTPHKSKSLPPNRAALSNSPTSATPAWKARLNKQGKKFSDPIKSEQKVSNDVERKRIVTQPSPKRRTSKSPKPGRERLGKKISDQKYSIGSSNSFELPLSRDEQPKSRTEKSVKNSTPSYVSNENMYGRKSEVSQPKKEKKEKKAKKEKKEKKAKKEKKEKAKDSHPMSASNHKSAADRKEFSANILKISATKSSSNKVDYEESDSTFNNDDVILRNIQSHANNDGRHSKTGNGDKVVVHLRKSLEEAKKQLEHVRGTSKQELSDLEKEYASTKESIRFRFMKDIHAQGKKTDAKYQEFKKVFDEKQKEVDELRSANQKLRATIQKLPKQMTETKSSNRTLEIANEDVAGHIGDLESFSKKLQTDQERLLRSNDKCKNEYLPRYRQQLWESRQHLDAETKIKNLYRDCIIKITKQVDKSRQADLIEEISSMVLETEGEVNPKFDPEFLSSANFVSHESSTSDYDDLSSSSDSSSSYDSD